MEMEEVDMWGFLIAMLSGALMAIQGVFNTGVTKETGPWLTNCFVQLTGFLVCLGFFAFMEMGKIQNATNEIEEKQVEINDFLESALEFYFSTLQQNPFENVGEN